MYDVFLSHSSVNKSIADSLCSALESKGLRVWIAPRDVDGGLSYAECIVRAVHASAVLLVLMSDAANRSENVAREVELAARAKKRLLAVRVEPVEPSPELLYFLGRSHWLDLQPARDTDALDKIRAAIWNLIERERPAQTAAPGPTQTPRVQPNPSKDRHESPEATDRAVGVEPVANIDSNRSDAKSDQANAQIESLAASISSVNLTWRDCLPLLLLLPSGCLSGVLAAAFEDYKSHIIAVMIMWFFVALFWFFRRVMSLSKKPSLKRQT